MFTESVIAVDIQKPAAFGMEMETAVEKGTQIMWPKFTDRYDHDQKKLYFKDGTIWTFGDTSYLYLGGEAVPIQMVTEIQSSFGRGRY